MLDILQKFLPTITEATPVKHIPADSLRDYDNDVAAVTYDVRSLHPPFAYSVILLHSPYMLVPADIEDTFDGVIDRLIVAFIVPGGEILPIGDPQIPTARLHTEEGDYFLGMLQ